MRSPTGITAVSLLRFVLEYLTHPELPIRNGTNALPPSLEELRPRQHTRLAPVFRAQARFAWLQLLQRPRRLPTEALVPLAQRHTAALCATIPAEPWSHVRARCRAERVTVHGAFLAAVSAAVADELGGNTRTVSIGSLVNLRQYLEPRLGEQAPGAYVAPVFSFTGHGQGPMFWDAARSAHQDVHQAIARSDPFTMLRFSELLGYHKRARAPTVTRIIERAGPGNITLTNLGNLDTSSFWSALGAVSLRVFAAVYVSGNFVALPNTANDQLFWNVSYIEQVVSRARAARIASTTLVRLLEACGCSGNVVEGL